MTWPLRSLLAVVMIPALFGCGTKGHGSTYTRPTLVSVNPTELDGVSCGMQPGQMRTYAATLWDTTPFTETGIYPQTDCEPTCGYTKADGTFGVMTDEECWAYMSALVVPADCDPEACAPEIAVDCDWFALPSSDLVDCRVPVGFSFVAVGHRYVGRVDGYDRDDLLPAATGSPIMTDPNTGAVVEPRWIWACSQPTIAVYNWDHSLVGCSLVSEPGGSDRTTIDVDTGRLLGDLECGDAADRVARFEITLDEAAPVIEEALCNEVASFTTLSDGSPLDAGSSYQLSVAAYSTGAEEPGWVTSCYADTRAGVHVAAQCGPLESAR